MGAGFVPVRQLVLVDLLSMMLAVRPAQRAVIAIDGADGVGTSRLAAELLSLGPHVSERELHRVSIDGFHHPRASRYARGRGPESTYADSYDYDAFQTQTLRPFRATGTFLPAVWDVSADAALHLDPVEAGDDAVLIVDGIFLRRPELAGSFDATLLVLAPPEANARDVGGHQLYAQQARNYPPTWIMDNTELQRPHLLEPDPDDPQWF